MSDDERETGEERIDEEGRNPTQQRIDEGEEDMDAPIAVEPDEDEPWAS